MNENLDRLLHGWHPRKIADGGVGGIDYNRCHRFFIILPSEQAFSNQQIARHQNPIYELSKEIKQEMQK